MLSVNDLLVVLLVVVLANGLPLSQVSEKFVRFADYTVCRRAELGNDSCPVR